MSRGDEAFRAFLRRVWQHDVRPLLHDRRAAARSRAARLGGKIAASTGLFVDSLLGLKGRPFARFMTVLGASAGAMLPDVWDWSWFRRADDADRELVADRLAARAAALEDEEALALFGLTPQASEEALRNAWRETARRWHPDCAADESLRREHHARFVAYQAAYERLQHAYAVGRLPRRDAP